MIELLELIFGTGCLVLALFAGLWGSWCDIIRMKIPNYVSVIIVFLWLPIAFLNEPIEMAALSQFIGALVILLLSFALYAFGVLGAGDSKLMSAYALWIPLESYALYFLVMGVVGAVLAAVAILWQKKGKNMPKWHEKNWFNQLLQGKKNLPYGVAITAGVWCVILPALWS